MTVNRFFYAYFSTGFRNISVLSCFMHVSGLVYRGCTWTYIFTFHSILDNLASLYLGWVIFYILLNTKHSTICGRTSIYTMNLLQYVLNCRFIIKSLKLNYYTSLIIKKLVYCSKTTIRHDHRKLIILIAQSNI